MRPWNYRHLYDRARAARRAVTCSVVLLYSQPDIAVPAVQDIARHEEDSHPCLGLFSLGCFPGSATRLGELSTVRALDQLNSTWAEATHLASLAAGRVGLMLCAVSGWATPLGVL